MTYFLTIMFNFRCASFAVGSSWPPNKKLVITTKFLTILIETEYQTTFHVGISNKLITQLHSLKDEHLRS